MRTNKAAIPQPNPTKGTTHIYPLVLTDIKARVKAGKEKYGTLLQARNGRDALWDAYQEAIDLVMYLRQAIEERETSHMPIERELLIEIRQGIIEAIYHEDGLDGAEGTHLLSNINTILGYEMDDVSHPRGAAS